MCGIAGIYFLTNNHLLDENIKTKVIHALKHRGPDIQNQISIRQCTLFHARLSILDLSAASNQPFTNEERNIAMVYNGEIFNYSDLQKNMTGLRSTGDAEVLFRLFEKHKTNCLHQLNGFFAFAWFDSQQDEFYIVRDRFGVKPLYYYLDDDKLAFASELKALLHLTGPQMLNKNALHTYFRLNYISGKETIFKNIFRLLPGEYLCIKQKKTVLKTWYSVPEKKTPASLNEILPDAVKIRLHADVPVGCFLSGGLDSSIISAIAKQQHHALHTFSIGFSDEPYFDETKYAELVATHIGSNHHVFKLSNADFLHAVQPFLNSIDEPFADSSALNVYLLSEQSHKHVKVALSGDGADELFMGYNKHRAEFLSNQFLYKNLVPAFSPVYDLINGSRHSGFANKIRQLRRFAQAVQLNPKERYMSWACISNQTEVNELLLSDTGSAFESIFSEAFLQQQFNPVNYADLKIVLTDDMLVKSDRMSMQHGLEIRSPFLDYRIVELAMNLPLHQKINKQHQKVILRNHFGHLLPEAILKRTKKGFELPLWKWLKSDLHSAIENQWLNKTIIHDQQLFNYNYIHELKQKLFSNNPGDAPAKIWALIVFQNWYSNFKPFIRNND